MTRPPPALLHAAQLHAERPTRALSDPANRNEATNGSFMAAAEAKQGGPVQEKEKSVVTVVDIWAVPETPGRHP